MRGERGKRLIQERKMKKGLAAKNKLALNCRKIFDMIDSD